MTIFEKIIAREIPAQFVYEDDVCVVVMDKFPGVTGQVLVIPKEPVDYLFDIDETTYQHLLNVTKRIVKALDTTYPTIRTCMVVEGFEVPHAHIKLFPVTTHELRMHGEEASDETLEIEAAKIKLVLSK